MKVKLMIATAVMAGGCAGGGIPDEAARERQQYLRENARIEATEEFQQLVRSCRRAGGVVHMPRQTSGRLEPTAFEMRGAICDRDAGLGVLP